MDFWTNVSVVGNSIGLRGVENGNRVTRKVSYNPTVYFLSTEPTEFRSFDGKYFLAPTHLGNIWETRQYLKKKEDVLGFKAFGNPRAEYAFITENFKKEVNYDISKFYIANIDIEVESENGFPDVDAAKEPILSITIEKSGKYFVWGVGDYVPHLPDITYFKCENEIKMLEHFILWWINDYPDILTGWNIAFFDIPYLLHRITNVFDEDMAKLLSPWRKLGSRRITQFGRERIVYSLLGIDVLDYMDLFKKFSRMAAQESYKLGDIAQEILGEGKVSYDEEQTLHNLYKTNFQKYIEYNIHDTTLVKKLNQKERLIELALTLAYQSHTNPSDVFSQVRMWTQIIDDFLWRENKFSTIFRYNDNEKERFEGAFVKATKKGMFQWVCSFDATSLYPSLIMQHNISPDTFIPPEKYSPEMAEFMSQNIRVDSLFRGEIDTSPLRDFDACLTANGQLFSRQKKGFMTRIIEEMFAKRQTYKRAMLKAMSEAESLKKSGSGSPQRLAEALSSATQYDALQNAVKVCLNSSFGAMGNIFFVYYDKRPGRP